ncbi:MAG: hypothetical protein IJV69_01095 [Kiritimatiellae bacterium]|nr:hypothetical protein [Kiritimatiellia bacterium]
MMKQTIMGLLMLLGISTALATTTRDWTATAGASNTTITRDWTATRQPAEVGKPLPSGTRGSDFALFDRNTTPLSLGILAPVQLPWGDWNVRGLRLSPIYGRCENLTGLDIGLWNTVNADAIGLQLGLVNTASRVRGLQIGFFNGVAYLKGLQIGVINYAEGARGIQIGLINVIPTTTPGGFPLIYGSF